MFGAQGTWIKAHTPGVMTFVVTSCNESNSYLPAREAFQWDVYEKLVTLYTPGTAEEVAEKLIQMATAL